MDIRGLADFIRVAQYSNPEVAFEGEIGSCYGFRIISTNFLTGAKVAGAGSSSTTGKQATSGKCDVHRAIAIGSEALGVADLDGGIENIIQDEETVGGPLKQFSTTGYKMAMAAKVVNTNAVMIYETAVSA
jgi:N4-gp56 family major capsid protein